MRLFLITMISLLLIATPSVFADQSLFYKEFNLIGGYSRQDKWIGKSDTKKNSLGFEDYRKFSTDYGDFLTTDFQLRVAYDSSQSLGDAWAVEIHNAWAEFKLGSSNKFRFGHFDPSFGLEPLVDTHGTILQTLAKEDIGFIKDWGVSLRGVAPSFDYEVSLQIGSGMSIYRQDGSYLATARVGSPSSSNFQYGISFLIGDVLETMGMQTIPRNQLVSNDAISKKRIGGDIQYLYGSYLLKAECAYGTNEDKDVLGYLFELDYTIPDIQNWELELQYKSWINDLSERNSDDSTLSIGTSCKLNQELTFRAVYLHNFNHIGGKEDDKVLLQLYYYAN